ncbi:MAG: CPBP family intramembrane metalloprotease [Hyphomicrobiales bacterium]|nr:CPBP family intramembrane metalloprotease [Hyphomicrobiales bacterium]
MRDAADTRTDWKAGSPGPWALAGLFVALVGPLGLASPPMQHVYASLPSDALGVFVGQASLWVVLAVTLACLVYGERLPLSSVGLVHPRLRSVGIGLAIGAGVYAALFAMVAILVQFHLFEAQKGVEAVQTWPLWLRLFALVTAGVVEEALYRGYAIERLTALTGRRWLAAIIALAAFSVAHVPFWGLAALATPIIGGGFFTIVYLWRRDLVACMTAHIVVDFVGLVIAPALGMH